MENDISKGRTREKSAVAKIPHDPLTSKSIYFISSEKPCLSVSRRPQRAPLMGAPFRSTKWTLCARQTYVRGRRTFAVFMWAPRCWTLKRTRARKSWRAFVPEGWIARCLRLFRGSWCARLRKCFGLCARAEAAFYADVDARKSCLLARGGSVVCTWLYVDIYMIDAFFWMRLSEV